MIARALWIGATLVGAAIVLPAGCVLSVTIPRSLADAQIEPKCSSECGIRVFETVPLNSNESRAVGAATLANGIQERSVGTRFILKQSHYFFRPVGTAAYRYTTWIERRSDGKRLSEMIWYFREGDEVFHGRHFPSPPPTEEQLLERTLLHPSAAASPLTEAPHASMPSR